MDGWRTESPGGHRFVTIVLGPTGPSGFADGFDPDAFEAVRPHWAKQGFKGGLLEADHVATTLASQLEVFFAHPGHGDRHCDDVPSYILRGLSRIHLNVNPVRGHRALIACRSRSTSGVGGPW